MYTLRPYQNRNIRDIFSWFDENREPGKHPVVSACVGSGKSIVIAEFIRQVMTKWPDQRILMAVHSRELVRQNAEKIQALWPDAPLGIHSAGLNSHDCYDPIIFASIGSIWRKAKQIGQFDLMLVDECHVISTKGTGMYRRFISSMLEMNPRFRVIGFTGTPFRGNGVWLWEGEDPLFHGLASDVSIDEMLDGGFLVPLVSGETSTTIDASGVRTDSRTGDYVVSELAKIADRDDIIRAAVAEIVEKARDRRSWLVYCVTLKHAQHVHDEIRRHGIDCEMVTGKTPRKERDRILEAFRSHRLRCVVNVAVLTTGFDHPATDMIALLRNTKSPVLMIQIAGRGMRIAPKKKDCLFLDFTDSTQVLGPINKITGRPWRRAEANAEAPTKQCPNCFDVHQKVTIVPAGASECQECGHEFEVKQVNHHSTAAEFQLISKSRSRDIVYPVTKVNYWVHRKTGKPDSMRVDYYSGLRKVASEWVCFEHAGYAREKAANWWRRRVDDSVYDYIPGTAQAIRLANQYARRPTHVTVDETGQYPKIKRFEF